jgi:acetyl esterase/lipase
VGDDSRTVPVDGPPGPETWAYGDLDDQVVEAWPGSDRCVVLLHGGFWRQEYDRRHLRAMAAALADDGVSVLLPEYRRVGGAGGWPTTFEDLRAVMATGPPRAGASSVVVVGHSAGGQLALWSAVAAPPQGLAGVVALAPVADLAEAYRLDLDDGAVGALLGGGPEQVPDRFLAADPMALGDPSCPVRLLHCPDDELVPFASSRAYARKHPTVQLVEVGGGHFGVIDPTSEVWPAVRAAVTDQWVPLAR